MINSAVNTQNKVKQQKASISKREDYPLILTVNEVQEILRIGRRIAYELMDLPDFPCIKIGKLKRVNREAFFEWIDKKSSIK